MTPVGSKSILDLRLEGKRPALPVLVSLIGRLPPFDGPQVIAEPTNAYDWTFIAGLETHVWLREGIPARKTLLALAAAGAARLQVWDVDLRQGAFVFVDTPAADARIEAAIEACNDRAIKSAFHKGFEGPGVEIWLSPFGALFNKWYAQGAAHLEVPCKS